MYILGPFSMVSKQLKFMIILVDYFTKWVEAKAITKNIATNIYKFFK